MKETDHTEESEKWKRLSKKCSWLLRHGALKEGLSMDTAGWVERSSLQTHLALTDEDLNNIIAHNDKTRFEVCENKIRASQGHSLATMPVTIEALEQSWRLYTGEDSIWHGTNRRAIVSIEKEGILAGDRTHVHLASSLQSHVGKRDSVSIFVEVSCSKLRQEGFEVFISPNGVVLTRFVPVSCFVGIRMASAKKHRQFLRKQEHKHNH